MAVEMVMPKLGMAMKEGTVSIWHKQAGDTVTKGEPVASINSEKIEMELEAPADGVLLDIIVSEGQGVPPGTVICYIGQAGEQVAAPKQKQPAAAEAAAAVAEVQREQEAPAPLSVRQKAKISPVARKMAEEANLDISKITGTGPGGRITKEDVQKAMEEAAAPAAAQPAAEEVRRTPVTGMRQVIARRMQESLQTSAQLTLTTKADVTDLLALQRQIAEPAQAHRDAKLTVTDFIARAVVLSLQQHKEMNSAYINQEIHVFDSVHLGVAVALEKGLVVPVIRNAQDSTLVDLSKQMKEAALRARQGQLGTDEMTGSTFTISNLGAYDVEHFTPILNAPETGILGVGSAYDAPVYKGEELQRRTLLPLSLTFDHRVLDGAPAAAFLRTVKLHLETPVLMLL
ncbi:dihydrolipoamide acetyltransferase family protein [Ectobacillus ponti]|uniref:Dihydrolipoamide acetyltransferase component of pyruvate dehydrogenase complex n=2 Tax=Bacteria TaxID=2 RepID=A0AA41X2G2_9BACI|nr:dihydrolipoamide acetyltransferase family protein [Ectobacillus ponti]MCP8967397.1 2-oxo acid dehydrogenase subunit E2 [Ectobacillus ponti]